MTHAYVMEFTVLDYLAFAASDTATFITTRFRG